MRRPIGSRIEEQERKAYALAGLTPDQRLFANGG